jgi:hypothetical protein
MTEPTPPPERPLSDEARARIRGELLEHAHDRRSTMPRWVVPAGAAAAVALVAGLSFWAINPGGTEPGGLPVTGDATATAPPPPLMPATPAPSDQGASAPTPAGPPPSDEGSSTPTPADGSVPATPVGPDSVQVGTRSCEQELRYVLRGATLAVQVDDSSSFWVKGDKFSLCHAIDGSTTVTQPLPLEPRDGVATYRVLSKYPPSEDGYQTVRAAGGIVPAGAEDVFDVAYTFPDGHTEHATKTTDDQGRTWWRMVYTYDDGGGNELEKPEITVTLSLSGVQETYPLAWGEDTCAQANHGC